MLADDSFDGQQNEVCIDVPFVDFIQDDERVFVEEVSAVDQSLQEDAVGHEDYAIVRVDDRLHADLIADQIWLRDLFGQNLLQVDDSQSPRLHAHDLGIEVVDVLEVLVDESRHLGGLPASGLSGDQHELILDYCVQDLLLLLVDGQLEDHLGASGCELDLWALVVDVPSDLLRHVEDVVILLLMLTRPISALPSVS